MGLVVGCLASAALHGGVFAIGATLDFSPVLAGWQGADSFGSDGDDPPMFTIHVRVGRDDVASESIEAHEPSIAPEPREHSEQLVASEPSVARAAHAQNEELVEAPPVVETALDSLPVVPGLPESTSAALPALASEAVEPARPTVDSHSPATAPEVQDAVLRHEGSAATAVNTSNRTALANEAAPDGGSSAGSADGERSLPAARAGDGVSGTDRPGTDARPLFAPKPAYPPLSKRLGEEGQVHVRISVARDGRVLAVKIVRSSGHARLDLAAIETLQRWRFTPLAESDERATSTVLHCVTFRLQ